MQPRAPRHPVDPSPTNDTARRALAAVVLGVTCALMPVRASLAQTWATLDVGFSEIRYDGFLASTGAAITPGFDWSGRHAAIAARGTYLRFESGNRSLQGSFVGSLISARWHGWRAEAAADGGASSYADFARFWHAIGEVRVLRASDHRGLWFSASAGRTSFDKDLPSRPLATGSVAAWTRHRSLVLLLSASRAFVGDTQYSDIGVTARGQRGSWELESAVGARFLSRGAGRGVYGEAAVILPVDQHFAVVFSGGRYPTDPIRGSIAGRFISAAIRLRLRSATPEVPTLRLQPDAPHDSLSSSTLTVNRESSCNVRLTVRAPKARLVEIAGDFTEWQPILLARTSNETWGIVTAIARGVHQMNLRIDGGAWIAPRGTTRINGDYGDEVGTFVVP